MRWSLNGLISFLIYWMHIDFVNKTLKKKITTNGINIYLNQRNQIHIFAYTHNTHTREKKKHNFLFPGGKILNFWAILSNKKKAREIIGFFFGFYVNFCHSIGGDHTLSTGISSFISIFGTFTKYVYYLKKKKHMNELVRVICVILCLFSFLFFYLT